MDSIIATVLRPQEWPATVLVLLLTTAATVFFKVFWRPALPKNAPKWFKKGDYPILGALEFYYGQRANWFNEGIRQSKTGNFSFYVGKKQIVGISGNEGRKFFYGDKDLSFAEGFAELLTGQPAQPPHEEGQESFSAMFQKNLVPMMKKENFIKNLDFMTADTRAMCDDLKAAPPSKADPAWRVTDPFDSMYEMVYQLTMRTVGANDIAENPALLKQTLSIFDWFERADSFLKVIFPWLPTVNSLMRLYYGGKLAFVFRDIIEKRKKTGEKGNDALQFLIDRGNNLADIVGFEIGALFAGQLNSGINAGYLHVFLTQNEEWMGRLRSEVDDAVARHRKSPSQSRSDVLGTLTIEDWESEFPMIDLALRETIRFCLPGTSFRKNNSGRDLPIGNTGEIVPNGAFAAFLVEETLHGDWYSNVSTWNPGRFFEENAEDRKVPYGYTGWGVGRHPCLGMKFAKLEMAFIAAFFIAEFDFELSDADGNHVKEAAPLMNRNLHSAKKPATPIYLRYKPRTG